MVKKSGECLYCASRNQIKTDEIDHRNVYHWSARGFSRDFATKPDDEIDHRNVYHWSERGFSRDFATK
jgi:hypothetical protein